MKITKTIVKCGVTFLTATACIPYVKSQGSFLGAALCSVGAIGAGMYLGEKTGTYFEEKFDKFSEALKANKESE